VRIRLQRSATVAAKDWAELSRNLTVMLSVFVPAIVFVLIPIAMVYLVPGELSIQEFPAELVEGLRGTLPQLNEYSGTDLGQILMLMQMMPLLLIVPLAVPVVVSTYSIIGEKQLRTLEPLLAAPVTTLEILVGKIIAAAAPGVAITWFAYIVLALAVRPGVSPAVHAFVVGPTWLIAVVVVAPAMTVLAVSLGIIVSSRTNDPRAAQQVGMLVILPIVGLIVGQAAGFVLLTPLFMLVIALVVAVAAGASLLAAVRLFDRETILTRWT
jgi:ABC-2 type transport system permease protein